MKKFAIALLACVGLLSVSSVSHAVLIFGIDDSSGQTLVAFDSSSPGSYQNGAAISGLQSGETIKGIDFRPATNQLFALGSSNRLYTLNPVSGAATQVGSGPFTPVLNGSNFGFDFNPVLDKIRVVSNTKKNYVLDPVTGAATAATDLAYGPGPNFGVPANVEFSAYTNSVSPAPATTQLFGIDTGLDILVTQTNSFGVLTQVGLGLGVNVGAVGGFDISGAGNTAYAAMLPSSTSASNLYSINLLTGAASNLGQIDGGAVISALSIAPDGYNPFDVPEPASMALLALAAVGMVGRKFRVA